MIKYFTLTIISYAFFVLGIGFAALSFTTLMITSIPIALMVYTFYLFNKYYPKSEKPHDKD